MRPRRVPRPIPRPGRTRSRVSGAYEQHIGRRIPGQRSDGTFQLSVSRSTPLGMAEPMERWCAFAARDRTVRTAVVDGEPRVSGTDRRITWRTKARDGSSVVVTSEPKKDRTASLIAAQIGVPTLAENDEAREQWTAVVTRFLATA